MHAQEVVELILKKAGKDVLKQIELAAAVKDGLTDVNPNKDLPVALAIVESVKSWLKEIKNKGRFPNDVRSLYHGVHQAVNLADAKRSDVARLPVLGTSSRLLKEGRARFGPSPRAKSRTSWSSVARCGATNFRRDGPRNWPSSSLRRGVRIGAQA